MHFKSFQGLLANVGHELDIKGILFVKLKMVTSTFNTQNN